jgi:hypothetical protein
VRSEAHASLDLFASVLLVWTGGCASASTELDRLTAARARAQTEESGRNLPDDLLQNAFRHRSVCTDIRWRPDM